MQILLTVNLLNHTLCDETLTCTFTIQFDKRVYRLAYNQVLLTLQQADQCVLPYRLTLSLSKLFLLLYFRPSAASHNGIAIRGVNTQLFTGSGQCSSICYR